jgi:hypothetical protein
MKKLKLDIDLERDILEGDKKNTYYFHVMANKRRKKQIHILQGLDGEVHDTTGIMKLECIIIRICLVPSKL